jgi:2-amino-4-hydroxy-6-hydroxymethyldihydropteridine diphosphokinase
MKQGIFLSLGTNIGNKAFNLAQASKLIGIISQITQKSSLYGTDAWGNTDQPAFYNQVLAINTTLRPEDLLENLLSIERELGRVREERWGPRVIDIDILFYNDKIIDSHHLTVPHPGIALRRFVLEPLAEIRPDFIHPVLQQTVSSLLASCKDPLSVTKVIVKNQNIH